MSTITAPGMGGLLRAPAPSFDDPIGMLVACHDRMRGQLQTLSRLARHVPRHGLDDEARLAARNVLRYFDRAAVDHHADEELSVLPRLIAAVPDLRPLADALGADHRALEQYWRKLRPLLSSIAAGTNPGLPTRLVHGMCDGYERHLLREERRLIPRARECLDGTALAAIGAEFAARRERGR